MKVQKILLGVFFVFLTIISGLNGCGGGRSPEKDLAPLLTPKNNDPAAALDENNNFESKTFDEAVFE